MKSYSGRVTLSRLDCYKLDRLVKLASKEATFTSDLNSLHALDFIRNWAELRGDDELRQPVT